ncbi:hypothetical protein [Longispora albida]|uniref:hypothetical protein n=1 Tax=Longispora albida TaxID=203523 RepID=UPI00037D633E|nr:hypothetical protein [Longispora albida]
MDEEINLVTSADRSREYAVVALCDIRYGKPTVTSGALNIEPLVQYGTLKDFPNGALYVASATVKDSAPNGPGSVRLQCGETYNTVRFTVTGTASTTKPKPVDKDKAVKVAGGAGGSAEKPSGRIETGGGATARG